jgi:flagellar biosynthesis protein FliQ
MNEWVSAAIAVAAGFAVGTIASRIVLSVMNRSKVQAVRDSAAAVAGLALSAGVIVGLLVALGFVAPDQLQQLGDDAIAFLPKAIAALVIVIGANVASTFAAAAVAKALVGTGAAARFAPMITKFAILGGGAIIAAGQTGVDTAVVNIAVAALLFGVAGALALLTGLGGRQVAGEIAAGRAWRTSLRSGDRIAAVVSGSRRNAGDADSGSPMTVSGVVVEVHPTAVELDAAGVTVFVPNSRLLDSVVERHRPRPADAEGEIEPR